MQLLLVDERVDPSAEDNYAIKSASRNEHSRIVKLLLRDQRVIAAGGIDDIIAASSLDD